MHNEPDTPYKMLKNNGYRLNRRGNWVRPTSDYVPTELELSAIDYLHKEWDFGVLE